MNKGKFFYSDVSDTTTYVTMYGDIQTERITVGDGAKGYIKSRVHWVGPCQYELILIEHNNPDFPFKPGDVMLMTVDKVEGNIIDLTWKMGDGTGKTQFRKVD